MTDFPETIYLQREDKDAKFYDLYRHDITWCQDNINDADVKYIRADQYESLRTQLTAAQDEYQTLALNGGRQLAELQALNEMYKEALESYKVCIEGGLICPPNGKITEALAIQSPTDALREVCYKIAEKVWAVPNGTTNIEDVINGIVSEFIGER